jgi:hypothetical protein
VNLATVMQQLADQLDTIAGLRVYGYPLDGPPQPPAAIVSYPDDYTFDSNYRRGMDRIPNLPVTVVVGRVSDRTTRERIGAYVNGSGISSVKQVIEAGTYTAFDVVRVQSVEFEPYEHGGNTYLSATFMLDIAGKGSIP